ncbi:MAG: RnfABCDGE type electron transport complex subunit G [Nitrospiraceae bacterium]|nr:RnfABCDGE type electron transport complex subunit G [Nitrospiraceae bacterium]
MTGKDIVKITLNLVIVYLIGGLILSLVYAKAAPQIYKNNEETEKKALKELMPDADSVEKMGEWEPHEKPAKYFVAKKNGQVIGYIVQSFGKGYSSFINTFIAVDTNFTVEKIKVLSHNETPGLGDGIEEPWFQAQFKGKTLDHLKVIKGETKDDIQALSGATISSRAVTEDAVKHGVEFLMKTIKDGSKGGEKANVQPQHG